MYGLMYVPKVPDIFRHTFPDNDLCVLLEFVASLLVWRKKHSNFLCYSTLRWSLKERQEEPMI